MILVYLYPLLLMLSLTVLLLWGNAVVSTGYIIWGALAFISTLIYCAFINFYQIDYIEHFIDKPLASPQGQVNHRDQRQRFNTMSMHALLSVLRLGYTIVYSWQDRLVAVVDDMLHKRCPSISRQEWYGYRSSMVLQPPFLFSTHAAAITLFSLINRPHYSLIFIAVTTNVCLFALLWYRWFHFILADQEPVGERKG